MPAIQPKKDTVFDFLKYNNLVIADASEDYQDLGKAVLINDESERKIIAGLHTFALNSDSQYNSKYFYYYTKSNKYKEFMYKNGTGISVFSISKTNFSNIPIPLENHSIQKNKSEILSQIDKLILNLKNKILKIEFFKEYKINNYFSISNSNEIPLSTMIYKNKDKNKNNIFDNVQSISNKKGFIWQSDQFEERTVASKDKSNYYIVKEGAIAYNPSRIDVGSIAYKSDSIIGLISPLYISFYCNKFSYNEYLMYFFKSSSFKKQINSLFEGSVRNTLSWEALKTIKINSRNLEEIKIINNELSLIDNIIISEKAKLANLHSLKKYLLQQFFD